MLTTVEGVYKEGIVALSEQPLGIAEARVLVVFLDSNGVSQSKPEADSAPQYIRFGQFPGLSQVTEEDFRNAEWHGDPDDELGAPGADI